MNETLEELARDCVGSGEQLYFCSNKRGIVAVFVSRKDALDWAGPRNMYVEGPNGCEQESSWSSG